jgi:integrase
MTNRVQNTGPSQGGKLEDGTGKATVGDSQSGIKQNRTNVPKHQFRRERYIKPTLAANEDTSAGVVKKSRRRHPLSKKHVISKLPPDFRDRMVECELEHHAQLPDYQKGNFLMPFLVTAATGCRPEELAMGEANPQKTLTVRIHHNKLAVVIHGAKVQKEEDGRISRGLEWRVIFLNPEFSLAARVLFDHCMDHRHQVIGVSYNKDSLRKSFNRAGKRYLATLKRPSLADLNISPYCFRHALASDLKSTEGVTPVEVATMMGHLSLKSSDRYGRKRRGQNGTVKPFLALESSPKPVEDRASAKPRKGPSM